MSDTHKWTIQIESEEPPECEDYTNQAECLAHDCYWYNNSCHSNPQPQECEDYTNQAECLAHNCYWYDNSCHSNPQPQECEDYTTQSECLAHNCYWYDNSCHSTPENGNGNGVDWQKNAIIAFGLVCAGIGGAYLVSTLKEKEVI